MTYKNAYLVLIGEITQATEVSLQLKSWLKDRSMVIILEWCACKEKSMLLCLRHLVRSRAVTNWI